MRLQKILDVTGNSAMIKLMAPSELNTKSPRDGAQRQRDWRNREREKGRTRRFDRRVTDEEYLALDDLFRRLRER
jgi:hypothetical protein